MSNPYSLATHTFMTAPDLSYFYVLDNADPAAPVIVEALPLGTEDDVLTLRYSEDESGGPMLSVYNSYTFDDPALERVILGTVWIQQGNFASGNAIHQVKAFYNGAAVKNSQKIFTVVGIGITDIISADPLKVSLIDAPLAAITNAQGNVRVVTAVQVTATQPAENSFFGSSNFVWTVSVLLEPHDMPLTR